jgi:DNA-binding XRE family transcriptional regulator
MVAKSKAPAGAGDCKSIRQLLLLTRAKNGWPAVKVAKTLKTTTTTYKAWEKGQKPKIQHFGAISRYTGVPVIRLVQLSTAPEAA